VGESTSQQGVQEGYGYLWWLNTAQRWPGAPAGSYSAQGAGSNTIWVDPEHDLVVVWRWHRGRLEDGGDAQAELYRRVIAAVRE
jgi:CubicO group peptidase (beta-lactamase class C family)